MVGFRLRFPVAHSTALIYLFLCIAAQTFLVGCDSVAPTTASNLLPHHPLQSTELLDLKGDEVHIDPQGHAATVFLFARTDCPISNRYAPTIRRIYEEFSSRDVIFYLVYVDPNQSSDEIAKHRESYAYPCMAVRDIGHELVQQVGARVTPEAVVVDRRGNVVYRGRIDDRFVDFGKTRQTPTRDDLSLALNATLSGRVVELPVTKAIGCFIADLKQ